jgi:hypothetical protein
VSQQVRFAPGSLDCVYVKAGHVTVQRTDGSERVLAPGHHPDWLDSASVAFCPPEDGFVQVAALDGLGHFDMPAGNTLTASAGKVAVHRTDPRRVLTSWGSPIYGMTDPALSADGRWLAMLKPDWPVNGQCGIVVGDLSTGVLTAARAMGGSFMRPRFSHTGTTLCWEEAGGAIYGIADVANPQSPVVRLSRPEDSLSHPVPCWVPGIGLFVLYVQASGGDSGTLMLAEWGSCVAQAPMGYVVAQSGGSGFDCDVKGAA